MLKAPLTGLTKTAKKILSVQKHPACASLFIGNLAFATTEDSLINLFARHMRPIHDSNVLLDKEKWLRNVRVGTFEDSGKCKGSVDRPVVRFRSHLYLCVKLIRWAFVDFTTTEYATLVLTNPRNHSLDGRALVVEYASPDAVRRSVLGHSRRPDEEPPTKSRASRRPQKAERIAAKSANKVTKPAAVDEGDESPGGEEAQRGVHTAPSTVPRHNHHQPPRSIPKVKRTKPGAALASAPRETGAIVASLGKRIVF
jgi:RNA recognition motif-containing protein